MNNAINDSLSSYALREPAQVMQLDRLGAFHPSRLSFMRSLMRRIMREHWHIECSRFELDDKGYGTVTYSIRAKHHNFTFVLFSNYLSDNERNDRVIASKWDLTMALVIGDVTDEEIENLRCNVPKQEAGRMNANVVVLSRANRSSRNFEYVVNELAAGRQPAAQVLKDVGYLYRTTAVYGSGKFGLADWEQLSSQFPDFARPFSAEMFTCYMLRHFSVEQADYLAKRRQPVTAVAMDNSTRRYIGIGNATGLGMAPYLIRHPQLISRWITMRETAIARVLNDGSVNEDSVQRLLKLVAKARQHFLETTVPNELQTSLNLTLIEELETLQQWLEQKPPLEHWRTITHYASQHWQVETQELIHSLLMELYPELVDELEDSMTVNEQLYTSPEMPLTQFKQLIETHYAWALDIDFEQPEAEHLFWYRSEEKMEPRIGERLSEPGTDREIPLLTIARYVRNCYDLLCTDIEHHGDNDVVHFLMRQPAMKGISARIQTMARDPYGDIQANLADRDTLPIHLLRCKLSFLGVSKFDPKSKYWVRNTMFQGAPLIADIGGTFNDDWCYPLAPQ